MMVSSERASAAALPSTNSEMLAAYPTMRPRGFANALVIEPPDIGQDRNDLTVAEHRAKRGHRAQLALLDALDDEFVAALGFRQFRPPARGTTTILVTETAGGGEHLLAIDVVRRGFGVRQRTCRSRWGRLIGKRTGRQTRP